MDTSCIVTIDNYEQDPLAFFKALLNRFGNDAYVPMNIASLDSEFGVLNRTVVFRGFIESNKTDAGLVFITERNTLKYKNLKENPKTSVTFLFDNPNETWQVRLIDAEAFELSESQIANYWKEEPLHSRIRSYLCECGKPTDHAKLIVEHDQMLNDYESGKIQLRQTKAYTAFKILAKRWDFYKSVPDCIADRVQFRKQSYDSSEAWTIMHIEP